MTALPSGSRPVADLVPLQAMRRQPFVDGFVTIRGNVVVGHGHLTTLHPSSQGGSRLDDQGIGRDVVDPGIQDLVQRRSEILIGLTGGSVDQVEIDVLETGCARGSSRGRTRARSVSAFESGEYVRGTALHAKGDPGEATLAQFDQGPCINGVRVGLGGHFGVARHVEFVADGTQHRCERL